MKFGSAVVVAVILLNVAFAVAVLAVSWHTWQGLDSLGKIKRGKIGKDDKND